MPSTERVGCALVALCHYAKEIFAGSMAKFWNTLAIVPLLVSISTRNIESDAKEARAMNVSTVSFRSFQQTNSSRHEAESRNSIEIDNNVNNSLVWENEANCGVATIFPAPPIGARVLGGRDAEQGKWPWIAMIMRYYPRSGFSQTCGGTLIKPQWVLTAGHCFFGDPASYTQVVLGAYYKSLKETSVRTFAIAKYICHHMFIGSSNYFEDDACLIKLAGPATYSDYIKPICLPTGKQSVVVGDNCKIAGWGVTTESAYGSNTLQTAEVPIVSKEVCSSWYMESGVLLPQDHFCAGYEAGGIDSCQGDSGGPLVCDRNDVNSKTVVQFGITSFGMGCGEEKHPGVYTEVEHYTKWIETKIQENAGAGSCFQASDLLGCDSVILESGTTFRSPADSQMTWMYPPNSRCSWDIKAPPDHYVQLQFDCFFHIEVNTKNTSECYDYITISSNTGLQSVYCGTTLPDPITIPSNDVTIAFYSDGSIQSAGFVTKAIFIDMRSSSVKTSQENQFNGSRQSPVITTKCDSGRCGAAVTASPEYLLMLLSFLLFVTYSLVR